MTARTGCFEALGVLLSLQLQPHRFLQCRELWRFLMQHRSGAHLGIENGLSGAVELVERHTQKAISPSLVNLRAGELMY